MIIRFLSCIFAVVCLVDMLLNDIKIERVPNYTFLGIILDISLSWKHHTKMIARKISKIIGTCILHKLKYVFLKEILLVIYKYQFA